MEQAEILVRLRKEKGLSQAEVAEELGVTRQAVSRWEGGRAFPSMEKQLALSRIYGVSVEELYHPDNKEKKEGASLETAGGVLLKEDLPPVSKTKQKRSRALVGLFLTAYFCFAAGMLFWGKLTNSPSMAANYLICGTLIFILGWLAYFLCLLFKLLRRIIIRT